MFDELKALITDAINDLDSDEFIPDVELIMKSEGEAFDLAECKKLFEKLINVAADAVQKEME